MKLKSFIKTFIVCSLLSLSNYGFAEDNPAKDKECNTLLSTPVLPSEMRNFWLTLSVEEQQSVLKSFSNFWNHHLTHSKLSLDQPHPVFVGFTEHLLGSHFDPWPANSNLDWVKQLLDELSDLPNTTPEVRDGFFEIKVLLETKDAF